MKTTLIIAAVAAGVLAITNPSEDAFQGWAREKITGAMKDDGSKVLANILAGPAVALTTTRQNLVFFSLFKTVLPGGTQTTLGILENFIPMSSGAHIR